MISEMANHTTSGISATAVLRCAQKWCTPSLAEPRPRARERGVLRSLFIAPSSRQPEADDPRHDRGGEGKGNDDPAAAIGILELEAVAHVPEQVPDAVAQVVEHAEQPAAEEDAAEDRDVETLEHGVRPGARGGEHHPDYEIESADRQRYARGAMQQRHHGGELPLVDLQMRRKRPMYRPIGDAHRAKTPIADIG